MIHLFHLTIGRWRRAGRIAALVLASAALLTGSNAAGQPAEVPSHDEHMVTVPRLAGRTAVDAILRLARTGLAAALGEPEESSTVPAGRVIRSIPAAGERVERGSWVQYVLSRGPPPGVAVPQLAGRTETEAVGLLARVGLNAAPGAPEGSSAVPAGRVIRSAPAAGTRVGRGSLVRYILSRGVLMVTVPQLAGRTEAEATASLAEAGLGAVADAPEESSAVPAGRVIRSVPAAGVRVERSSQVRYVLSRGVPMVAVPPLTGLDEPRATMLLRQNGLAGTPGAAEESSAVPAGRVIRSVPAAGTRIRQGSIVQYVLSRGVLTVTVPSLAGRTEREAIALLEDAGLVAAADAPEESSAVPAGRVIRSVPAAGAPVRLGSQVRYVLSRDALMVPVPRLEGLEEGEAIASLERAGLIGARDESETSEAFGAGQVVRSSPPGGEQVRRGSRVRYVLSLGSVEPPPRNLIDRLLEDPLSVLLALLVAAVVATAVVAKFLMPQRPKFAVRLASPPRGKVAWGEPPALAFDVRVDPPKASIRLLPADPDEEGA
jgi:beta-lactam-binding protein with PASTA domain